MVNGTGRVYRWLAVGAVPMALVTAARGQVDNLTPVRAVREVPPEVAVGGLTPDAFMEQQQRLHRWLTAETPAGADGVGVSVGLTDQDRQDLITPPIAGAEPTPMRVGVVKAVSERVGLVRGQALTGRGKQASSVLQRTAENGYVWTTTVTSPGAVALRVHLVDFSLPPSAEAYFFSPEGEAYGPYVGTGPDGSGDFWSNSVASSTGIVLVRFYGPADVEDLREVSLRVTEVGHVALDFPRQAEDGSVASFCTYNASCIQNDSCVNEPAVNNAEGAVAKMRWISGAFINICSGGLIADTDAGSQIPYFLTANHCINRQKDANNLECYFQYAVSCGTSTCVGSFNPAPAPMTLGATIKAHATAGDFSLLQLSQNPPSGSVFLGWNNAPIAFTNGADLHRVSHPSGAPQAYSHHQVDSTAGTCTGWPRGERIYSNDIFGATEGGSSGSPVVNAAGQVVGQLSGCCGFNCGNVCDTASNSTVDGAFAFYWPSVEPFLDPAGGGGCSTNAECDDGLFCNGAETCSAGTCVAGANPCPGQSCDEASNTCVSCSPAGASCTANADCCSNSCKGKAGSKTCR